MGRRGVAPRDIKLSRMSSAHPAPGQPPAVIAHMVDVAGLAVLQGRMAQVLLTWPDVAMLLHQAHLPGHGLGTRDLAALLRVEALLRGEDTSGEER